ncbi:ABC transporter transmembrane domain-containing protein [Thermosipho globiformans]|uniref:ABC transporter transmembrane domain-containing protein n=1 Tax=Thermosipho globiformans TaxID=380685 RepID=UPI001F49C63F|nr:ABC transporter transmembrane domain-containing protein [Thermosipho globiformans]
MKKYTKKQILQLFKEHFLYLLFVLLLLVCATGMTIPIPLLSKNIINSILTKSISNNLFKIQIMLLLIVSLSKEFLMYISYYIFESRMRLFSSSLRKKIFEVAQNNFNQISSLETGRLLTYISSDTEAIRKLFYPSLVFFMKDLLTLSFALTVGLFLNSLTVVVSILPLVIFFSYWITT